MASYNTKTNNDNKVIETKESTDINSLPVETTANENLNNSQVKSTDIPADKEVPSYSTAKKTNKTKISESGKEVKLKKKKDLAPHTKVTVINGAAGKLTYVSKITQNYKRYWNKFGEANLLELSELISVKSSEPKFFVNNWFIIEDPDVVSYLELSEYYKNTPSVKEFNNLFNEDAEVIKEKILAMKDTLKRAMWSKAYEAIKTGELDSRAKIKAIESATGMELIEE